MIVIIIFYMFVPITLFSFVASLALPVLEETLFRYFVTVIWILVFYLSGVFATYRYSIWRNKNLSHVSKPKSLYQKLQAFRGNKGLGAEYPDGTNQCASEKSIDENSTTVPRKRVLLVVALILATLIFAVITFLGLLHFMRNHPSHQAAINFIEANPRIVELIGDVESVGFLENSSLQTYPGGYGQAEFFFRVYGINNSVHVQVQLIREPSRGWIVVGFDYRE